MSSHVWGILSIMQGDPGHTGLKGNRGERGPLVSTDSFPSWLASIKPHRALSQFLSHPSHARILVSLKRDYVGRQVLRDLKERWENQWVCLSIAVFRIDNIRFTSALCCVTQGRTGMDGGRGIPGEPGSKVNLHQWLLTELQQEILHLPYL